MTEAAMPLSEDDIALAGELAMRLLAPAEEAQARARITRDSAFAEEVLRWEERLMPLADDLAGVPAPDHVWGKITAQIAPAAAQDRSGTLRFWQGLSFVSTAAAAALALMLVNQPAPVPVQPSAPMIAALSAEGGKAAVTASFDATSGDLIITPVSLDTGPLYPELWVIPKGGTATSLGVIDAKQARRHSLPLALRPLMARGATLAITPEPEGGAPGGKATGPVIASGKIDLI